MRLSRFVFAGVLIAAAIGGGCTRRASMAPTDADAPADWSPPALLSDYRLFDGEMRKQLPAKGVVPYDLNTPLFSDYALKFRFIRTPPGAAIHYHETEPFHFPVGTVIAKTFSYPADQRRPEEKVRHIETRILLRRPEGWIGLPYLWNADQTDAKLDLAGGFVDVSWTHFDGQKRAIQYIVPNANQCQNCHARNKANQPIGPKARHLNRDFLYVDGSRNQLAHWSEIGLLKGAPDPHSAPKAAVWNDPETGTIDRRARAWLDINCAHCHQPGGAAAQSGLDLSELQKDAAKIGVWKLPVAAGRGSGGRLFDVVPGKPDESILVFRIESAEPGVMMPELPRRLVDAEGVRLIRQWISQMPDPRGTSATGH